MQLQQPTKQHLLQVMEWVRSPKVFNIWAGPGFRFPFTAESFIEDLKLDELETRVLIDPQLDLDNQVQAFGQIYQRLNRTHLGRLVVNPHSQGKGIGTQLIKSLMALGDTLFDCDSYSLFVLHSNTRSKELYQRLGFEIAEYPEIMPLADCHYMVKRKGISNE
jgi:ribosomal protein S18 acetylase RimI-like enzyme